MGEGGGDQQARTQPSPRSPVRASPLQEGPGRGHRPVTEAKNGAENPNQPFVHTKPKQQRRPTHPETQTPELSPPLPLPPSPSQPPQPRFSRRLVTRSEGPETQRPQGYGRTPPATALDVTPSRPTGRHLCPPSTHAQPGTHLLQDVPSPIIEETESDVGGVFPPVKPILRRLAGQGPPATCEASTSGRERSEGLKYS